MIKTGLWIGLFVFAFVAAKSQSLPSLWKTLDSLQDQGLPQSALAVAEKIRLRAEKENRPFERMKAELYGMALNMAQNEDPLVEAIAYAESRIDSTEGPKKALWQSLTAELYWNHYQQHRWKVHGRSPGAGAEDLAYFDAAAYGKKILDLYMASVDPFDELVRWPLSSLGPLIHPGKHREETRPFLYDLLAHRALEFLGHGDAALLLPTDPLGPLDPRWRLPMDSFISAGAMAPARLEQRTYSIYQRLYRIHREQPTALLDLDLQRWAWVYQREPFPATREAYRKAMEAWASRYPLHPLGGLAHFRRLQLEMETLSPDQSQSPEDTLDLNRVVRELETLEARFPREEAGMLAHNEVQRLKQRQCQLHLPEAGIPGENQALLIGYQNISRALIRVYKGDADSLLSLLKQGTDSTRNWVSSRPAWGEWTLDLPGPRDYRYHSTEWVMESWPAGAYLVWVQSGEDSLDQRLHAIAYFQQSRLALLESREGQFQVLDRASGAPLSGVRVQAAYLPYGSRERRIPMKAQPDITGKDGQFSLKGKDRGRWWIRLEKGEQTLIHEGYLSSPSPESAEPQRRSFFYTDRGLYRPGQTVHFKAIILDQQRKGTDHQLVTGQSTRVYLLDAQGQRLDSLDLKTSEWGSVAGSFSLPEDRMNGRYRIENPWGGVHFSVEAYQRPGFQIRFDTPRQGFALGDTVLVQGEIRAYSGQALAHREGVYRIWRRVYWPYLPGITPRGRFFPPRPQKEEQYTQGRFRTDAEGGFSIRFPGLPASPEDSLHRPVYTFEVEAEITDRGGETRTARTQTPLGYQSLLLHLDLPETASRDSLLHLPWRITNLRGVEQSLPFRIRIYALEAPDRVLRPRLWAPPDRPVLDSLAFRRKLPHDAYGLEQELAHWPRGEKRWDRTYGEGSATSGAPVPASVWNRNGGYEVVLEVRDPRTGEMLDISRRLEVWDPGMPQGAPQVLKVQIPPRGNPGDRITVLLHSDLEGAHVLEERFWPTGRRSSRWIKLDGRTQPYVERLKEEDAGGLGFQYTLVHDNRVYRVDHRLAVPYAARELEVDWKEADSLLRPGDTTTWTLQLTGPRNKVPEAEWMLALYDQSLDALLPHDWTLPSLYPSPYYPLFWSAPGFSYTSSYGQDPRGRDYRFFEAEYPRLVRPWAEGGRGLYLGHAVYPAPLSNKVMERESMMQAPAAVADQEKGSSTQAPGTTDEKAAPEAFPLREDFRETAFFIPQARTGPDGEWTWTFQIPEALTRWKFMGIAHTREGQWAMVEHQVTTSKPLMVQTGLPRFLFQGDQITLESRISNLECASGPTRVRLDIEDPLTGQNLNLAFGLGKPEGSIFLDSGSVGAYAWKIRVPESRYAPVKVRVQAERGACRDGEAQELELLSRRVWVTETLPLWMHGDGEKEYFWKSFHEKEQHEQRVDIALTAEYYSHPLWLVLPSLPYLAEPRFPSAESVFGKLYSGLVIQDILHRYPEARGRILEAAEKGSPSPWNRARDMVPTPIGNTPWVQAAASENQAWEWLVGTLEADTLDRLVRSAENQLLALQSAHGGFSWFPGMPADRQMTQYILSGIGRWAQRSSIPLPEKGKAMVQSALAYVDAALVKDFRERKQRHPERMKDRQLGPIEAQYLYLRRYFAPPRDPETREAWLYYLGQAETYWKDFPPQVQAMLALALQEAGRGQAEKILASLLEHSLYSEAFGRYWKRPLNPYSWVQAPLLTQVRIMEAFQEIRPADPSIREMTQWLIRQKQSRHWPSALATIDATHILLRLASPSAWDHGARLAWQLGDQRLSAAPGQASLGYWRQTIPGPELDTGMARIRFRLEGGAESSSWGTLYWQYVDQRDQIDAAGSGLSVEREILVERPGKNGSQWVPLGKSETLKVGDRLRVVLFMASDRDMDYVHIQDAFASAWTPESTISGYHGADGIGYYRTADDAAMHFFVTRLPKGKFQIHYDLRARQAGEVDAGLATLESLYAPSFRAQSQGRRIQIKAR